MDVEKSDDSAVDASVASAEDVSCTLHCKLHDSLHAVAAYADVILSVCICMYVKTHGLFCVP